MEFPQITSISHTSQYPSISPSRPSLSTAGKHVIITGGGEGIGAAIAFAFALSGSANITLLGRTLSNLQNNAKSIESKHPGTQVLSVVADITDSSSVAKAFTAANAAFGTIDILVSNAGQMPSPSLAKDANIDNWWSGMEVNVKGSLIVAQAFLSQLPSASDKEAVIVNVGTAGVHFPAMPLLSGYAVSKLAALKLWEYIAAESEGQVRVMNFHPGAQDTQMGRVGQETGVQIPFDDISLPAGFAVWCVSSEAKFLKGKFLWASWDVDELVKRKAEFEGTNKFTIGLLGWE